MERDRIKWNRKYAEMTAVKPPAAILRDYWRHASKGRALDLACGMGQNSLFLAEHGFEVDAVDISEVALARISAAGVHPYQGDLDHYRLQKNVYNLAVNILFLDRRLFRPIEQALRPGGLLIFETFLLENDHISSPQFKLKPNELLEEYRHFQVLHYEEKDGIASLVAKKPQT